MQLLNISFDQVLFLTKMKLHTLLEYQQMMIAIITRDLMKMRTGEVGSNSWTPEDLSQWSSLDLQVSCWACMVGGLKSFRVQGLWNLLANLFWHCEVLWTFAAFVQVHWTRSSKSPNNALDCSSHHRPVAPISYHSYLLHQAIEVTLITWWR